MKKKSSLLAFVLAIMMIVSTVSAAWAFPTEEIDSTSTLNFEKVGEDGEYVYFVATVPIQMENGISTLDAEVPVFASFQTAVNKTQGKIAITISIVTPVGLISTVNCSSVVVNGAMGSASEYGLSASNLIPRADIHINHIFTDLKKNVEKGTVTVSVGGGTFAGFGIKNGYFVGGAGMIDLADC